MNPSSAGNTETSQSQSTAAGTYLWFKPSSGNVQDNFHTWSDTAQRDHEHPSNSLLLEEIKYSNARRFHPTSLRSPASEKMNGSVVKLISRGKV